METKKNKHDKMQKLLNTYHLDNDMVLEVNKLRKSVDLQKLSLREWQNLSQVMIKFNKIQKKTCENKAISKSANMNRSSSRKKHYHHHHHHHHQRFVSTFRVHFLS